MRRKWGIDTIPFFQTLFFFLQLVRNRASFVITLKYFILAFRICCSCISSFGKRAGLSIKFKTLDERFISSTSPSRRTGRGRGHVETGGRECVRGESEEVRVIGHGDVDVELRVVGVD